MMATRAKSATIALFILGLSTRNPVLTFDACLYWDAAYMIDHSCAAHTRKVLYCSAWDVGTLALSA